jgi:glycosyltransferase involved in cell wall biosynthesis
MEKLCRKVYTVERDESKRITGKDIPRSISFCYTREMVDKLGSVLEEIKPDVAHIEFLNMTRYAFHIPDIPLIYTEHDISNIDFEQSFHDRDLPEHLRYIEWHRLVKYEKQVLGKFKAAIVLTERDKRILKEFSPETESVLIPTGVDTDYYRPKEGAAGRDIVFVGHYRHYPNYDAFKYFVEKLFPEILKKRPGIKFYAVGSGVVPDMEKYASDNVVITGTVEDVREYMDKAAVFVAPVRLGGGIKGKVLEAMSSGVPVVATTEAGSGIKCTHRRDILISATDREFIDNTLELLGNGRLHGELAAGGRELVTKNYDWKNIAEKLDSFYDGFIKAS